MNHLIPFAVCFSALLSWAGALPPASPAEMAAETERWMVEGAGARFPDGMAGLANDGDFVFVDGTWPVPFQDRVGEAVALRVSPETGCYEFADAGGIVFWIVIPVEPLTWNWISPFRSPLRPDAQDLYSPFRIARKWLLLSPAEFESHAERAENAEPFGFDLRFVDNGGQSRFVNNPTGLCFASFSYTETNLCFAAAWPTNETLPESVIDLYGSSNLSSRAWLLLSSHPVTTNPVSFAVANDALPWFVEPTQHVHDATCASVTNIVASPLDGVTVYTNVLWSCSTNRVPGEAGFFRLGTRFDGDGDGLADAYELLVLGTATNAVDTDLDGLSDADELELGTDPLDPDTDGDGLPDGTTASSWNNHSLQASYRHETNLVVVATASVPTNASACLRIGTLSIPLPDGESVICLRLQSGTRYSFRIRCTRGATVSAQIVPAWDEEPLRGSGPPRSSIPGFERIDPDGGFSGDPTARADGTMAAPLLGLQSRDGLGSCVHETPGTRSWNIAVSPGSWSQWSSRAEIEGFSVSGSVVSLSVADESPSVVTGTVRVASTEPGFPPAEASETIHRCGWDDDTGGCPFCTDGHDTTGMSFSVYREYRYARVGTTNRCYFTSLLNGNESLPANWTVTPELPDGARLHAGSAPNDPGSTFVSGALSVWLTPGSATNAYTVTATLPFAPDRPASKTFTAIAIDAEPICTETTDEGFVVNPCMVPTGETATFRIKVLPTSVPDSDIRWYISGGHAQIQGSSFGREIRVRGTSEGPVHLEVSITGYQGVNPTFDTYVADMVAVPVDAWIVVGAEGVVVNNTDLTRIIGEANPILRQVCISCYVHQVFFTNRFDWVDLSQCTESEYDDILDEMCSVGNNSSGMEIHFVQRLLTGRLGENDSHGMVLPSTVNGRTFAHETGHAMGLHDVYAFSNDPPLVVSNACNQNLCPDDWSGNDPRGFYMPPNLHFNIIRRVIMCGDGNPVSRDFPAGEVYGVLNLNGVDPLLGWADVGVCSGSERRLPHHD